jgi:hypothetical protein
LIIRMSHTVDAMAVDPTAAQHARRMNPRLLV